MVLSPLPDWLRWAGVVSGIAGGGLLLWTFRTLGPNLTDTVVTRKTHTLVTRGPYRWVRHPFYDSAALCILANSLVAANWFILLTGVLALGLLVIRTNKEEENLLKRFGDSYRAYQERTGRFWPKFGADDIFMDFLAIEQVEERYVKTEHRDRQQNLCGVCSGKHSGCA